MNVRIISSTRLRRPRWSLEWAAVLDHLNFGNLLNLGRECRGPPTAGAVAGQPLALGPSGRRPLVAPPGSPRSAVSLNGIPVAVASFRHSPAFGATNLRMGVRVNCDELSSTFRIFALSTGGYRTAQKMSSEAMKRRASSMGRMVRPNGPALVQRSFHSDQ
jgi:hypothetical protein